MTSNKQMLVISGQEDVSNLLDKLRGGELHFKLSRSALIALLRRYLNEQIAAEILFGLAEMLEMNECANINDIGVNDTLFELANPEINGALTKEKALSLIDALLKI